MCLSKVVNIVITHPKLFAPRLLRREATHSERQHIYSCGSPLQGFGVAGTNEPRVWSPLQGYAPWALGRVAPLGLTPPPGNQPRSTTSETVIPHPALHKDKGAALWRRAALWVAPAGLRDCGHERTQGLVALAGLRTLGSGKGRPAGACPAANGQLAKERNRRDRNTSPHSTQH